MIFKGKIDPRTKDSVKFLVQEGRVTVKEIPKRCGISYASVHKRVYLIKQKGRQIKCSYDFLVFFYPLLSNKKMIIN